MHDFDRTPDQIRVSVEASDSGGTPDEVFALELRMSAEEADVIERFITDELKWIVSDTPDDEDVPPAPHILRVERSSASWGGSFSTLEITLAIQAFMGGVASSLAATAIEAAFRRVVAKGYADEPLLTEAEAEDKARYELAFRYGESDVQADALKRIEVGQDVSGGRWSFTFEHESGQYWIELGFIRGIPSSIHIRRTGGSEDE